MSNSDKEVRRGGSMTTLRVNSIGLAVLLTAFMTSGISTAADVQSSPCKTDLVRSTYLLGADDQLQITGPEPDETTLAPKVVSVDGEGDIQVPLVGRVHVAGMTVQQAEQELNKKLSLYVKHPQAAIDVKELRSQPASVLGAVNQPGVHQVAGHKTLLEMISLAGGVRPDAGYSIRITRQVEWGCIPLPGATVDASGRFSVAQVKLQDIMEAKVPEENIQILPHDVISVPKAELVYVTGDVKKSGGFVLGEKQNMSVLQAISMAEGLGPAPDTKHAKILRMTPGADQRTEIPVDLKVILQGKGQDVPLQGNDILFVPDNTGRKVALRALEAAITTGSGLAIYRP
jgi:polysaccharide export outer membrane protein